MLIGIDIGTLVLLTVGHLVAMMMSVGAAYKEYHGLGRSTLMGAYLYVAFISALSIVTYSPAIQSWAVPVELVSTVEMIRNVAIMFFVIGLGDLLRKKAVPRSA